MNRILGIALLIVSVALFACPSTTPSVFDAGLLVFDAGAGPHGPTGTTGNQPDGSTTAPTCNAITCPVGACGPVADGCGNLLECGGCSGSDTCGGGGMASQCGTGTTCLPRTCQAAGANCGLIGDGCGNRLDCGSCTDGEVCGGNVPSVCSGTNAPTCTGLCLQEQSCPDGGTTSISGVVYAPGLPDGGTPDPLYNASVYIPNGPLADFSPTIQCVSCAPVSGAPLMPPVTTLADGTFTLDNVPVGTDIPLVIQLGKWRRVTSVTTTACQQTVLTDPDQTRMPRTEQETSPFDNIPQIAMVTGSADPLECVLRKIGIADTEFTAPSGTGRVHVYVNNGAKISSATASTYTIDSLTSSATALANYDMVIFACDGNCPSGQSGGCSAFDGGGGGYTPSTAEQTNVVNYANAGGRVFATHYSYAWLWDISPFAGTATWAVDGDEEGTSITGIVNQTFDRGIAFAQWLEDVGASTTLGNIPISQYRHDFTAVTASEAQLWLSSVSQPLHYTFNTPVGPATAAQCGRVLYSDFHVNSSSEGGGGEGGQTFPAECSSDSGGLTAQERALEFMLFDLSSCIESGGVVAH